MQALPSTIPFGPFSISFYGICIALAVFVGFWLAKKRAHIYRIKPKHIDDLLFPLVIGSILAARLYHILDQWAYYRYYPQQILAIWQGGIAIYGAIIGGIVVCYFYAKQIKINFLSLLDLLVPSVILGQAIGRWGNFFNQEAFGPPTNLPWKIYIDPNNRPARWLFEDYFHPLFLYESLWNLAGFGLLIYIAPKLVSKPGSLLAMYLIYYGIGRLLIEQLRYDTAMLAGLKVATVISVLFILAGTFWLVRNYSMRRKSA